jgi:hypothetical protein
MELAPIVLFAYKRPEHTLRTLEALSRCKEAQQSTLCIYSDGPKNEADMVKVEETRQIIRMKKWCQNVYIYEAKENMGLANSVIKGVTEIVNKYKKIIVLEDDLLVDDTFIFFMNQALSKYEETNQVLQISGYMFPIEKSIEEESFFIPIATSWGWATWKRAWDKFDVEATGYEILNEKVSMAYKFDLNGSYPYSKMLYNQMSGKIDSWAIRWYWSFFKNHGLCLYPKKSLVNNIGMDGSGTHCHKDDYFMSQEQFNHDDMQISLQQRVFNNKIIFLEVCKYLKAKYGSEFIRLYRIDVYKKIYQAYHGLNFEQVLSRFKDKGYRNIGIYGGGIIGEKIYEYIELSEEFTQIVFDKNRDYIKHNYKILDIPQNISQYTLDVIIIGSGMLKTICSIYDNIIELLGSNTELIGINEYMAETLSVDIDFTI